MNKKTNKWIEEYMQNFTVVENINQEYLAYPAQITKFQDECIKEIFSQALQEAVAREREEIVEMLKLSDYDYTDLINKIKSK